MATDDARDRSHRSQGVHPEHSVNGSEPIRFTDAHGRSWQVFERLSDHLGRRDRPSLVFESSFAFRRVRQYPTSWRLLSPQDLELLSWKT